MLSSRVNLGRSVSPISAAGIVAVAVALMAGCAADQTDQTDQTDQAQAQAEQSDQAQAQAEQSDQDAQPDFEGIWNPRHPPRMGQPDPSTVMLTAAGQAEFDSFTPDKDPTLRCLMPGIPLGLVDPYPIEIVQQDHQILILYEHFHQVRRIFMDGREAPDHWLPSFIGYSTGEWDGDTLVIRTTHMRPDNYMWTAGFPFSGDENTYVIERWWREGDVLQFTGEVHDPTYYEEPYVVGGRWDHAPDGEIWEYECIPEFGGIE